MSRDLGPGGLAIVVILVTGKAGAGKTTYADRLAEELQEAGKSAIVLDGDRVRQETGNLDYSETGRESHLRHIAGLAAQAERTNIIVIVAVIAPKRKWRRMMQGVWKQSRLVYLPGGQLWPGTIYEQPDDDEFNL